MECKQKILVELDDRISKLKAHEDDLKPTHGNQFEELNHAVSSVIGAALSKEIASIKDFVQGL